MINIIFYILSQTDSKYFFSNFGFIPTSLGSNPGWSLVTLISASFLHADWWHLIGNSIFLFAFGRSIENEVGTAKFLGVYPFLGIMGFLLHWLMNIQSNVPVVGASASISTLMGIYLIFFPKASIHFALILIWFIRIFTLPAWIIICYWAGLQFISVLYPDSSVAYGAHVGGFLSGLILGLAWKVLVQSGIEDQKLKA